MAFTNFKWFKHLIVLSQRFQRNKKNCEGRKYQSNIPLPAFSPILWSVVYRLGGMLCGVWNAGYFKNYNTGKHEKNIFVSMNCDKVSKRKAQLTTLKF